MAFLGRKGQISIEFILLITIALIYINVSVWPAIEASSQSAIEVKGVADTKIAAIKLAGALDQAFLASGDMRKTIGLYLPESGEITCDKDTRTINYTVQLSIMENVSGGGFNPDEAHCAEIPDPADPGSIIGWNCASSVQLLENLPQGCAISDVGGPLRGPIYREMVVERTDDKISFEWK